MFGKAVRIRHCPATVIGMYSGWMESLRKREDLNPWSPSRKSGDRFLGDEQTVSRENVSFHQRLYFLARSRFSRLR
jgi:hypothetical protein